MWGVRGSIRSCAGIKGWDYKDIGVLLYCIVLNLFFFGDINGNCVGLAKIYSGDL